MSREFKMTEDWGFIPVYKFLIGFNSDDEELGSVDVEILVDEYESQFIGNINDTEGDYTKEELSVVRQMTQNLIDENKLKVPYGVTFNPLTGQIETNF